MNKVNWQERLDQLLSTGKNKSYFTAGVTILFIVVMSIVGIVPAISSLGQQAEDNAKRDILLTALKDKLSDLETLTIAQDSDSTIINYFDKVMSDVENQEATINLLNDLAKKNDLNILNFNFDKRNVRLRNNASITFGENIKPLSVTISVSGQKDGLLSFLNDLENSAKILNAVDVSFNRVEANSTNDVNSGRYSLSLSLVTYYFE